MSLIKCDPLDPVICGHGNCLVCLYKAWLPSPERDASVARVIAKWAKPAEEVKPKTRKK